MRCPLPVLDSQTTSVLRWRRLSNAGPNADTMVHRNLLGLDTALRYRACLASSLGCAEEGGLICVAFIK